MAEAATETQTEESANSQEQTTEETTQEETQESNVVFPENWRQTLAGEDEKRLAQLERFTDPTKLGEAFFNAQEVIRSGQHKMPTLAEDASEEDVKAFREANGIPLEAAGYEVQLSEGLVVGEADQPFVDAIVQAAHEENVKPEVLNKLLDTHFKQQAQFVADIATQDEEDKSAVTQDLMESWGNDYTANKNAMQNFLSRIPESARNLFAGARVEGGKGLLNHPELVKSLVEIERQINPVATIPPNSGADPQKTAQASLDEINKIMREDRKTYDKDLAMQKLWRELTEFLER